MSVEPKPSEVDAVDMPAPTAAPLVMSLGIAVAALGVATSLAFSVVGAVLFMVGLSMWIFQLLPGRGHELEPLVEPARRAVPLEVTLGRVERIRPGMPGYRLRLPERVHPISAGVKGGMVGGLVMPLPAMVYGVLSGHGIWLPINLLAGMLMPGVDNLSIDELEEFRPLLFGIGASLHVAISLILGLLYGVLMPTLPNLRKPIAWGALLMPLLWTALSFVALGIVNPATRSLVDWPWFVMSQLVFGLVAAVVFMRWELRNPITAGVLGGIAGGALMPIPALLWAVLAGHTVWYPVNLLAAMAVRYSSQVSAVELDQFHADWFTAALLAHAVLSITFGLAFGVMLPRVPAIPSPIAWGGLVMPLLWTASSYGLMGVVNPVLQQHVDWPWFVVSQFVFGVVAAMVVVRSEQIVIPPAGRGPDDSAEYLIE